MSNLVKRYVLVDADEYNRGKEMTSTARLPNPFANPDVEEAKRLRRNMHSVAQNSTLDVEDANAELQELMNRYLDRYANAKGKKTRPTPAQEALLWNELRKRQGKKEMREDKLLQFNTPKTDAVNSEDWDGTPKRVSRGTLLWNALHKKERMSDSEEDASPRTVVKKESQRKQNDGEDEKVELTPFITRRGAIDALDRSLIPQIFEQKMSPNEVDRAYPLLNQMYKVGLINEDGSFKEIRGEAYKLQDSDVREVIKDVLFRSPTRRSTNPTRTNWMINFLTRRGVVDQELRPTQQRKTTRSRKRPTRLDD